ncbi:MAG: Trm112 family protein [Gammaproteobacteria bacterium]|nr:MAG: Trm112 family protein [Gammaproteobacteria bacterium]
MDKKLLSLLACPVCKGELKYNSEKKELICRADGMAFPVRDGVPVMLESEARTLSAEERLD